MAEQDDDLTRAAEGLGNVLSDILAAQGDWMTRTAEYINTPQGEQTVKRLTRKDLRAWLERIGYAEDAEWRFGEDGGEIVLSFGMLLGLLHNQVGGMPTREEIEEAKARYSPSLMVDVARDQGFLDR